MARYAVLLLVFLVGCQRGEIASKQKATSGAPGPGLVPANEKSAPAKESKFADWPKPAVTLVLTGQQIGYIEPCGCTGLENQKGGLARRHTLFKQLAEERGWPVVPLDVGSQVKRFG